MTAVLLLAHERPTHVRDDLIASRLRRFAWRHREVVRLLARRHSRLADLALSFPALLFALAVPRQRFDPEPIIERAIAGAPLGELAAAAGIPMWTRKLTPEAFQRPLRALPDGDVFRRQIANHLPRSPKSASRWLEAVADTNQWGHAGLAVWYARRVHTPKSRSDIGNWPLIALWAWHCDRPEAPASRFLTSRWSPDMSAQQACSAASEWRLNMLAGLEMGDEPIADPWAEPAMIDGYSFEPILTAADLVKGAKDLDNCARTYSGSLADGYVRLWLVSRDSKRLAMLSLVISSDNPYPMLGQMSGVSNKDASVELWLAAHRWVRACVPLRAVSTPRQPNDLRRKWRRMWRSYWLEKRGFPEWLPLAPGQDFWRVLMAPRRGRRTRRRRRMR